VNRSDSRSVSSVVDVLPLCAVVGLGGLFAGVTGPLLSAFVPPLVRDVVGDRRALIGAIMAIDNVLLLLVVPIAGALSDRAIVRGHGRLSIVLGGFVLAALGMAVFAPSARFGVAGLIGAMVLIYTGINLQRSPLQALVADVVPSRYRSLATGSVTFQMCVGAIVFLMLGRALGMQPAFLVAGGTVLAIAAAFKLLLREPVDAGAAQEDTSLRSIVAATLSLARGAVPGMRAVFLAAVLVQLVFQSFTTWYALHGIERFGIPAGDAAIGFIAWAMGGVAGALPAGAIGVRIGRRQTMLLGFALMAVALFALDRVTSQAAALPLLAFASASWTLPMVNAYPLFIEPIPRHQRGFLAALFLLSMALGGAIGDPMNGVVFDLFNSYRPLFLLMTLYTVLAFVAIWFVPRGAGESASRS
jgi:maltose/moltooligosaccharide transporter